MVVVYSGDSERPAPDWKGEHRTPLGPAVSGSRSESGPRPDETARFLPVQGPSRQTIPSGLFDALSAEPPEALPQPEAPPLDEATTSSPPEPEPRSVALAPELLPDATRTQAFIEAPATLDGRTVESTVRSSEAPTTTGEPRDPRPERPSRAPRAQPGARRPSTAPPAPSEASVNAAKALAARGLRVSGRPPPEEVRVPGVPRSLVIGLWVVAIVLALFLIQRARARNANEHAVAPPVRVEPTNEVALPKAPAVELAPHPESAAVAATAPSAELVGSASGTSPARPNATDLRTVKLEVMPADSKVFVKGVMHPGPPFLFEVQPGAHVVAEVVHPGYAARRVVLDGSKPEFAVGLLRQNQKAKARDGAHSTRSSSSAEVRPAAIRSGL